MVAVHKPIASGTRYGQLRYLAETESNGKRKCVFKCDCGKTTIKRLDSVRCGDTTSCGCVLSKSAYDRAYKHGHAVNNQSLYNRWMLMHDRCYNTGAPDYHRYGGRGIRVARVWHGTDGLQRFVDWSLSHGYERALQLDRQDNNGHYTPENCAWVTPATNASNRSNTFMVTCADRLVPLARLYARRKRPIPYATVKSRIHRGWSLRAALTTPRTNKWETRP